MVSMIHCVVVTTTILFANIFTYKVVALPSTKSLTTLFNQGGIFFEQSNYTAAKTCFESYLQSKRTKYEQEKAAYYLVLIALANQDPGLEVLLEDFIMHYPYSDHVEEIRYHLADFFYKKGELSEAITLYQKIQTKWLSPKAYVDFQYKLADTYLQLENWVKAEEAFSLIQDHTHPYYYPAQLQRAYIALQQANYDAAHALLKEVSNSKEHCLKAQNLILKTFHTSRNFDQLIAYVQEHKPLCYEKENQLFIAEAYFFLQQYEAAIVPYKTYLSIHPSDRESQAKLGYALYETKQYDQAIACFEQLSAHKDHYGQIAHYHMGLIYEKKGKTQAALAAFDEIKNNIAPAEIQELSWLKYAGLLYQKSDFSICIASIKQFIEENPESNHLVSAQILLLKCYAKIRDYASAVDYIESLPYKNEVLLKLQQKVLFYRGLQIYNSGTMLQEAIHHLRQSTSFPLKQSLLFQAYFWIAEAFATLEDHSQALKWYQKFMEQDNSSTSYYEKTLYGLGYAYLNTGHYDHAIKTFEQYLAITQKESASTYYDATLRLADCYYINKHYHHALNLYESVYPYHPAYVRYQETLIHQALGNPTRATQALQEILTQHTQSPYYAKARYHEAATLFNEGHYQAAIEKFSMMLTDKINSDLEPDVLIKRAIAYENLKKYEEASQDYITILENHASHIQAESALIALSNLFTAQGMSHKIDPYLRTYAHIADKIAKDADQRTIDTAKTLFYRQKYKQVLEQLASFDTTYPQSPLLIEAYFFMAESHYRLQALNQALIYYKKITTCFKRLEQATTGQPRTNNTLQPSQLPAKQSMHKEAHSFHVKAWLRIADFAYKNGKHQEALTSYQKLKSMKIRDKELDTTLIGLIKSSFMLKRYAITTPACLQILNTKNTPAESIQQAHLYLGKIAMQRCEYTNAKHRFLKATNPLHNKTAAEAQYLLACATFKLKAYQDALNDLFSLTEKFPCNKDYIDEAFLLMADIYIVLGNLTQAKATLTSIISKSKNKKTIDNATKKRDFVLKKLKS